MALLNLPEKPQSLIPHPALLIDRSLVYGFCPPRQLLGEIREVALALPAELLFEKQVAGVISERCKQRIVLV